MKHFLTILALIIASTSFFYGQTIGWTTEPGPTTHNLYGIAFSDSSTWVAVGDGGTIIRSSDSGVSWSLVSSPVTDQLRSVAFEGHLGIAVGISGRVIRSTDSGLSWTEEPRPTTRNLYAVSISSYMAVITGEEGTILVSRDSGLTWTSHTAGTASILFGVSVNDSTAVGVGGQGAVVMSVDGGAGWGLTILGGQLTFFYGTSFAIGSTGWAVGSSASTGNVIIKSTDYGFVWSAETAPTTEQLFGVSFSSLLSGCAVGTNGTTIFTSDGGNDWVSVSSGTIQTLSAVSFFNSSSGIAVGDGGTILKRNENVTENIKERVSSLNNFSLDQNYPNPFNPTTKIKFNLQSDSHVTIDIFNIIGQKVSSLINKDMNAGEHSIEFNASNLTTGVYIYRFTAKGTEGKDFIATRKMILLK